MHVGKSFDSEFEGASRDILQGHRINAIANATYTGHKNVTYTLDDVKRMLYADLKANGLLSNT